ncbi:MAG: hypothetical protein QOD63_968 [Actinomycetota bacterium]|nr:hypothetical protein [Actinomycetota bacterium]
MSELPVVPAEAPTKGIWSITARMSVYRVLSGAAAGAIAVLTARQLGPSERGILVLLLTLSSFTLLLCSVGLNTSGRIHLVGKGDGRVESGDFVGLSATLTLLDVVVCAGLGLVLLPLVHVHLSLADLAIFGLFGGSMIAAYLANASLNAFGWTATASAVDAVGSAVQLIAVLGVWGAGARSVDPYLVAMLLGNVLQLALALVVLRRHGVKLRPRCSRGPWRRLVRTGLPGIALDVGGVLTFKIDRYLIAAFLAPAAVGIYSVAATASELLRMPVLALSQPIFYRLASGSARISDFRHTRRLCLAATAALVVVMFLAAPVAVETLFGPDYAGAVTPLRILLLAEFGITAFYLDASSLAAGLHKVGAAGGAAVVGLVFVAVGDLILIPSYGIAGAAWASVVAYSAMGLVAHLLVRRHEPDIEALAGVSTVAGPPDQGADDPNPS